MNVYFISGLGADRQAFEKLKLPPHFTLYYLDWIKNKRAESLEDYAKRLATTIDTSKRYAIVGLSMGGMMAVAMRKFLQPNKTVIISSVTCADEFPPLLKLARYIQAHRFVPSAIFNKPNFLAYFLFGARTKNEKRILNHIIGRADPHLVKWSIGAIINWRNKVRPPDLFHIHGDKDKILPVQYTKPDIVIKNGTHFMIWTKAKEVSRLLIEVLEKEDGL